MDSKWKDAQKWELDWHDNCVNSFYEEEKQLVYAEKMGLAMSPTHKTPYNFDLNGRSILDIGSGPYSLLLKCVNFEEGYVVDPLMDKFPEWVKQRYRTHGLLTSSRKGEDLQHHPKVDEVWIYNVLEHVEDPKKIIENAKRCGRVIRIFEWLETPPNEGHPQTLKEDKLNDWLGGKGKVEKLARRGATGLSYYGIFLGDRYE